MMRFITVTIGMLVLLGTGCASAPPTRASVHNHDARNVPGRVEFDTAETFAARGDFVRAEQYFVSALRNGYPAKVVIVKLLRVCLASSRPRAALSYAQLYLLDHPEAWSLRYLLATLHAALDQPDAARSELERVLQARPTHEASLQLLALLPPRTPAKPAAQEAP